MGSRSKVRVLQITGSLGVAGLEAVVVNWHRNLDTNRFHFDYVVTTPGPQLHDQEVLAMGARIHRLPAKHRHPLRYAMDLRALLVSIRPDIVHVHTNSASAAIDLAVLRSLPRIQSICHSHNSSCIYKAQHYALKPLINPLASHRVACSPEAAEWLFGDAKGWRYLPNGVSLARNRFNADSRTVVRGQLGVGDSLVLGHVGSFQTRKNQQFLLRVLRSVVELGVDARLVFVGEGPTKSRVDEEAQRMGLGSRVLFVGTSPDVPAFLSAFDVFLFPSEFEGAPLAPLEALANGLPVIASDQVPSAVRSHQYQSLSLSAGPAPWAQAAIGAERDLRGGPAALREGGHDDVSSAASVQTLYEQICAGA